MDRRIFLGSAVASAVGATLTACGGGDSSIDPALDLEASSRRTATTTTTTTARDAPPSSRA